MNQTHGKTRSQKRTVGLPPRMQDALEQYRKKGMDHQTHRRDTGGDLRYHDFVSCRVWLRPPVRYPYAFAGTHPTHWNGGDGVLFAPKVL